MNKIVFNHGITHIRDESNLNQKSLQFTYNYRNITDNELQTCKKYIKSLFPVKEEKYYIMNLLANLLNGKLTSEYPLYVLYGNGENGKSIFKKNLKRLFDSYYNDNYSYYYYNTYIRPKNGVLIHELEPENDTLLMPRFNNLDYNFDYINIYITNFPVNGSIRPNIKYIYFRNNFNFRDNNDYRLDYYNDPIILFQTIMHYNEKIYKKSLKGLCILTIKKCNMHHNLSSMLVTIELFHIISLNLFFLSCIILMSPV